jgi:hypothetical protein
MIETINSESLSRTGDVAHMAEYLPKKHEALSSISSTSTKRNHFQVAKPIPTVHIGTTTTY